MAKPGIVPPACGQCPGGCDHAAWNLAAIESAARGRVVTADVKRDAYDQRAGQALLEVHALLCAHSAFYRELDVTRAERDDLRAEVERLRALCEAADAIGYLTGTDHYIGDHDVREVRLSPELCRRFGHALQAYRDAKEADCG